MKVSREHPVGTLIHACITKVWCAAYPPQNAWWAAAGIAAKAAVSYGTLRTVSTVRLTCDKGCLLSQQQMWCVNMFDFEASLVNVSSLSQRP